MVDISGLKKADVLAVLYNAASPHGMGFLQTEHAPLVMTRGDAQHVIDERGSDAAQTAREMGAVYVRLVMLHFDYVYGRPIKSDLSGDEVNERSYDHHHGTGAAAEAVGELRSTGLVMTDRIFAAHARRVRIEAERVLESPEQYTALERMVGLGDFTDRLIELTRKSMGGQSN